MIFIICSLLETHSCVNSRDNAEFTRSAKCRKKTWPNKGGNYDCNYVVCEPSMTCADNKLRRVKCSIAIENDTDTRIKNDIKTVDISTIVLIMSQMKNYNKYTKCIIMVGIILRKRVE